MNAPSISIKIFLNGGGELVLQPKLLPSGKSEGVTVYASPINALSGRFIDLTNEEAWALVDAIKMTARA